MHSRQAAARTAATLVAMRPLLATRPCQFSCTPQQVNLLDAEVRQARWSDPTAARTVDDVVGYGAVPAFALAASFLYWRNVGSHA